MRGNHRWPVDSPHKGLVTRKMFSVDDIMMHCQTSPTILHSLQWRHNGRGDVSDHQTQDCLSNRLFRCDQKELKQRVLMHGHQGWNVRHGLCHIYMIYVYIWVVYSFCLFCCLFIIVTTQFVALYEPSKPKPKPSTYDPPDNHPLAEIQRPILRPEPKQQICHQHANTDHFGK